MDRLECNDYSRQSNIFDRYVWNKSKIPVNVIGVGASGSWLTLALAKMGIEKINVYDFDTIGEHNIPNQAFDLESIGRYKVNGLKSVVERQSGIRLNGKVKEVTKKDKLSGVVFMLTDTMSSRKEIYESVIKHNPNIELLIETRMDLRCCRIYSVCTTSIEHMRMYETSFYDDTEAEVSACGTSQTVVCTAMAVASHAIWSFLNWVNNKKYEGETLIDFENNYIINNNWNMNRGE